MRRYYWIIPFVMMAFAALACDSPTYDPPHVSDLYADPGMPGKAYALVTGTQYDTKTGGYYNVMGTVRQVYETRDYGQDWFRTTADPFKGKPDPAVQPTRDDSQTLAMAQSNGVYSIVRPSAVAGDFWTFPRSVFRMFFYAYDSTASSNERPYFQLPYAPTNSVDANPQIIYVSAGTEGVVVGPNPSLPPEKRPAIPYKLTNTGLDLLNPLPLTISAPDKILIIIVAALIFPPLALLHFYLLSRAYRYAFQPGEKRAVNAFTRLVTAIITVCAIIAIIIWVTNAYTDYYPIVGVMTLVCVVLSLGGGVWISRRRHFTDKFTRRMALASGLLALIVPIGVASIYIIWPVIIAGLFLYMLIQRVVNRELARRDAVMTVWQADRLAIEVSVAVALLLVPLGVVAGLGLRLTYGFPGNYGSFAALASAFIVLGIATAAVGAFIRFRATVAVKKKSAGDHGAAAAETMLTPLFTSFRWWRDIYFSAALWAFGSGAAAFALFMAQLTAASVFNTMLVH